MMGKFHVKWGSLCIAVGMATLLFGCGDEQPESEAGQASVDDCAELSTELEETRAELEELKERIRKEEESLQGLLR